MSMENLTRAAGDGRGVRGWNAVRILGTLFHDAAALERAAAALAGAVDSDELVAKCRRHGATFVAVRNLELLGAASPFADDVLERLRERARERTEAANAVEAEVRGVLELARAHSGHLMKGHAMRRFYDDPTLRQVGDIDLHFDDLEAGRQFMADLRTRGWEWDNNELPWLKWHDGSPYGQWSMLPSRDATLRALRLDLHIGPYSVGQLGLLRLERWERVDVLDVALVAPDAETTLALVASHAAGDFFLSMKDINDVAMIATHRDVDWLATQEICDAVATDDVLRQLAWWASCLYGFSTPLRGRPDRPLPIGDATSRARAIHVARMARRQRGQSGARAWLDAFGTFAYYRANLKPRSGSSRRAIPTADRRNRFNCWRMLPQSVWQEFPSTTDGVASSRRIEDIGPGVELVSGANGACAVRAMGDVFVPTLWGRVSPASVALAAHLADGV